MAGANKLIPEDLIRAIKTHEIDAVRAALAKDPGLISATTKGSRRRFCTSLPITEVLRSCNFFSQLEPIRIRSRLSTSPHSTLLEGRTIKNCTTS